MKKIVHPNCIYGCPDQQVSQGRAVRLPQHLDRLLDLPFTRLTSLEVDRWLAYLAAEGVEP